MKVRAKKEQSSLKYRIYFLSMTESVRLQDDDAQHRYLDIPSLSTVFSVKA
jgi:hypothetical protein